jgi:hypothetical protein
MGFMCNTLIAAVEEKKPIVRLAPASGVAVRKLLYEQTKSGDGSAPGLARELGRSVQRLLSLMDIIDVANPISAFSN